MQTAHHMIIYGCKSPGRQEAIYNCGSMVCKYISTQLFVYIFVYILQAVKSDQYSSSFKPCGSGQQVVYAWAKNAPELELPEDVGFRVGGPDSEIDWLVLQVSSNQLVLVN